MLRKDKGWGGYVRKYLYVCVCVCVAINPKGDCSIHSCFTPVQMSVEKERQSNIERERDMHRPILYTSKTVE